nr:DUF4870 domain-containing protein [Phycisphaerales bacterium]
VNHAMPFDAMPFDAMPFDAKTRPARVDDLPEGEQAWGLFMHLSTIMSLFVIPAIPALVMWLIKRKESAYLDDTGKEVLNFQISLFLYLIVGTILAVIVVGFILIAAVYILGIVGIIKGTLAANRGEYFRYPMCIRIIR